MTAAELFNRRCEIAFARHLLRLDCIDTDELLAEHAPAT